MADEQILLTRIDNRLVHGQVGVTWTSTLGANLIIVADDLTAEDRLTQRLMSSVTKSSSVEIRFYHIDELTEALPHASADQKIFLVVRSPQDVLRLAENNTPLKSVNIGNMHYSRGKKPLNRKVYVDAEDTKALLKLLERGIELFIQDVPGAVREDIKEKTLREMEFE
ncbi:MAG: PTS N-acetylgalactosamine transporter subunit IIB [Erysipelotrichia bacterium]|nr:PTS N-acetylgalactosamine transporter subunit IIB [Erysipelotrichia bacterium]